ncbi:helix-turn-helix domain-containing protein [Saccharicrinis aurantiacus]|uniref:helix-turn-helix domain-containing protein n=1 Tax=Saccharicrinis aurantiacus TaxID=1849719 RepID=UPI002492B4BF|nr:AraC family transcriptional regulator [Saccharicrinis aurantiacus]
MNNNFPLIVREFRNKLGLKDTNNNDPIIYNGKKGELFAFNKDYDDGLEILLLHGKLSDDFSLQGVPISSNDKWVLSFTINVRIQVFEKDILQTEIRNGDAVVMYNHHFGFNMRLKANEMFFICSIRYQQNSLSKLKHIIAQEGFKISADQEKFLFVKLFVSPEIRSILTQIGGNRNMGVSLLHEYLYAKAKELSILHLYDISVGNSKLLAINEYKMQLAQKVRDLIISDLSKHYSIQDLSKRFLVSGTVIKEAFVKVFGIPIYSFYQEKRLTVSKDLLNKPDMSVTEVAYNLGFSSPSNFIKFFKAKTGMSPSQYQKKV